MGFSGSKIDHAEAQRELDEGKSIRDVAIAQGVSTQAIYRLLQRGSLYRGASEAHTQSAHAG